MLAPVGKLWTTPVKAVEQGLALLRLDAESRLLDPGCGDGRVLLTAAKQYGCCCTGYEINSTRARETQKVVESEGLTGMIQIHDSSSLEAGVFVRLRLRICT